MLTKIALNKLTESVSDRIVREVQLYNLKLSEAVTEEDLYEQFCNGIDVPSSKVDKGWQHLKTKYPPVFTELLSVLRTERKDETLKCPFSYQLRNIIRADIERLAANLEEFDSDALIIEQLFEKIYPMLVDAKYIYLESEKHEPVFDLSAPSEEVHDIDPDSEEEVVFDPPYASSGNENSQSEESYDEGDWE